MMCYTQFCMTIFDEYSLGGVSHERGDNDGTFRSEQDSKF